MIHDVDAALRELVRRDALQGSDVNVSFDAPTREWSARRSGPTLNLFLYEIREDLERRHVAFVEERDEHGRISTRRQPARRYKLNYLVTAWTQRPEDEHRLLSVALGCFASYDALPREVLPDALAAAPTSVVMTIAWPPSEDRLVSDVWTALGGDLKPSLDLTIVAPLVTARRFEVGPPVLEEPRLAARRTDATAAEVRQLAARAEAGDPTGEDRELETIQGGTEARPGRVLTVRQRPS